MTKEEIAAGLKNALDRGSSIEEAVQSFVNAGYNANEVMEAASLLGQGVSKIIQPAVTAQAQAAPAVYFSSVPIPPSSQLTETKTEAKEAKKPDKMKWILIISLILLLIILAGSIIYLTLF